MFIDILNVVGTAAFAISGVLVGIKSKLDVFGIFVLSIFTACGGGLIRDVIITKNLPVFFTDSTYIITIFISVVLSFLVYRYLDKIHLLIQIFDALGLGVFTVLSAYQCVSLHIPLIGIIFISVLAGVGGGIIRDILVSSVPLVLRSEIYALASIIGALSFYFLYTHIDVVVNIYISIAVVFIVRMGSIYFNLNLPVIEPKGNVKL